MFKKPTAHHDPRSPIHPSNMITPSLYIAPCLSPGSVEPVESKRYFHASTCMPAPTFSHQPTHSQLIVRVEPAPYMMPTPTILPEIADKKTPPSHSKAT
ncbi:hypothetical protein B0O80DRAFT_451647 [Mortierella sp. GBAus27b]|nr:hypothetical protein B0O80DRAFT_451647 [Mortierella sp. GBAus27b]